MKLSLYIFSLFLLLGCFSSAQSADINWTPEELSWIKNHKNISFGYEPHWEPYEIYEQGEYSGIVGEYLDIVSNKTGIQFTPIPDLTWKKSLNGLKNGTIDMVPSCAITPEREKHLLFSDVYINDPLVIVTRKDGPYLAKVMDMNNMSVALAQNYYTIELIKDKYPTINIHQEETIENCLKSVLNGKSDAFIGNLNVVSYYMNNKGYSNLEIVGTTEMSGGQIAFAANQEFELFIQIVNKVLRTIPAKKKFEIRKEWISQPKKSEIISSKGIIWIIIVISGIVVIFTVLYYWNRILRKIVKNKKKTEQQLKESLIELKKKDDEKKVLLQEIHHRVKNNLQVVSSMMRIQANIVNDPNASKTLIEAVERVKTIALVHDRIYKSPTINAVDLKSYIKSLFQDILLQFEGMKKPELSIKGTDVTVEMDKIVPLALILNELITNSMKYAFEDQDRPKITIAISIPTNAGLSLTYADNGKWKENPDSDHFGTSLIEIFTEQLEGTYKLTKDSNSTIYAFTFYTLVSQNTNNY